MLGLDELWEGIGALRTSLPFAFALPLLVALVFASIVDWIERRLNADLEDADQDEADATDALAYRHQAGASGRRGEIQSKPAIVVASALDER